MPWASRKGHLGTWRQLFWLQFLRLQKYLQKQHGEVRAQLWAAGREKPSKNSGCGGEPGTGSCAPWAKGQPGFSLFIPAARFQADTEAKALPWL